MNRARRMMINRTVTKIPYYLYFNKFPAKSSVGNDPVLFDSTDFIIQTELHEKVPGAGSSSRGAPSIDLDELQTILL